MSMSHQHKSPVIALAGNPNVGKSTVFNQLTGLKQHTGNWAGKTVTNAQGICTWKGNTYIFADLPGCYSLMAQSADEEAARDFICFENPDAIIVVCDGTCLERNLNLVLQILEINPNVIVCVNLMDEAARKKIQIDLPFLSQQLRIPVVGISARTKKGIHSLMQRLEECMKDSRSKPITLVQYPPYIEDALSELEYFTESLCRDKINPRWVSLRLLDSCESFLKTLESYCEMNQSECKEIQDTITELTDTMLQNGIDDVQLKDDIVSSLVHKAEEISSKTIQIQCDKAQKNRKIDRILTSRLFGFPIMIALLLTIFWLTITGANYPSKWLSSGLFWLEEQITNAFIFFEAPAWLHGALVLGIYRVLAFVVSVMLPPMAIFFPLFTMLEDFGYLPRVAFNLDRCFKKCNACGKQALTMCMGDEQTASHKTP